MCDAISAVSAVIGVADMVNSSVQDRKTRKSAERESQKASEKAENERLNTLVSTQKSQDMAAKKRQQAAALLSKGNDSTNSSLLGKPLTNNIQTKTLLGS